MKTVKELISEGKKAASFSVPPTERKVKAPPTILFRRTAIRQFPDNHIVALYYSEQLDKYVSIPFGPEGKAMTIELSENESPPPIWANIKRKEVSAPKKKEEDDDTPINWKNVRLKKDKQINEFFQFLPAAGEAAAALGAGARMAAPWVARNAGAIGRGAVGAGSSVIKGLGGILKRLKNVGRGVLDTVTGSGGSSTPEKGVPVKAGTHEFDKDIAKRSITPVQNAVAGASPITNYRQRQNQNYIWNTGSQNVRENLENIIESKKSIDVSGVKITPTLAKKLVALHESLNTQNKETFEAAFGSADALRKIIQFSLRK